VVWPAERDVGNENGCFDQTQRFAFRGDNPNSSSARAVDVSLLINRHPVRVGRALGLGLKEDASFRSVAIRLNGIRSPVFAVAVAHVQRFVVRGVDDAVGNRHVVDHLRDFATVVEVHGAGFLVAEIGVGEIDLAVARAAQIVRLMQLFIVVENFEIGRPFFADAAVQQAMPVSLRRE
jgi:hypothetical protein